VQGCSLHLVKHVGKGITKFRPSAPLCTTETNKKLQAHSLCPVPLHFCANLRVAFVEIVCPIVLAPHYTCSRKNGIPSDLITCRSILLKQPSRSYYYPTWASESQPLRSVYECICPLLFKHSSTPTLVEDQNKTASVRNHAFLLHLMEKLSSEIFSYCFPQH